MGRNAAPRQFSELKGEIFGAICGPAINSGKLSILRQKSDASRLTRRPSPYHFSAMDNESKGTFEKVEVEGVGPFWIARARGEVCGAAFGKGKRKLKH